MASDDARDAEVVNRRFWEQVRSCYTIAEIEALHDWAGEIERLDKLTRSDRLRRSAATLVARIGWYTRP